MERTRFESIGSYTPATIRSNDELLHSFSTPRAFDLARITGIRNRRVYDPHPDTYESSFTLARAAIDDCLSRSDYAPSDLDIVISVSITRTDNNRRLSFAPAFAHRLANTIGATRARHFDISNACAGMVTGVMVLDRMIRAGVVRTGLVVSGEQITPIAETAAREIREPYDPQFASLTVGDAATAVVVDARGDDDDEIHYVGLMTDAADAEHCLGMPSDRTGGLAMYTDNRAMQNDRRYSRAIAQLDNFFHSTGRSWGTESFDFLVYHQFSGPALRRIIDRYEAHFGAPAPQVLNVLEDFGNTASTSHFLVLHEYLRRGLVSKGSKILMIPSASGMVYGYLATTVSRLEN
ncbi:3-oxoacyl-ACP synthase III family protein [Nocardia aurea]|uniref:3-oxoacyl-ACP synthase III family protein n=1 Tax=Nocardia aurea TaxID=2144174 RepID=UPI0033A1F2FE